VQGSGGLCRKPPCSFEEQEQRKRVKDINELIRQREAETGRLHAELERIDKELEALRLAAKLLNDTAENSRATTAPATIARDVPAFNPTSSQRPAAAPVTTPSAWASAKQFP
jgi:hypothetical protein